MPEDHCSAGIHSNPGLFFTLLKYEIGSFFLKPVMWLGWIRSLFPIGRKIHFRICSFNLLVHWEQLFPFRGNEMKGWLLLSIKLKGWMKTPRSQLGGTSWSQSLMNPKLYTFIRKLTLSNKKENRKIELSHQTEMATQRLCSVENKRLPDTKVSKLSVRSS